VLKNGGGCFRPVSFFEETGIGSVVGVSASCANVRAISAQAKLMFRHIHESKQSHFSSHSFLPSFFFVEVQALSL
jgi:hypothetical protein